MLLPLLRKELIETAARPRTYVFRTIYALIFMTIAMVELHARLPAEAIRRNAFNAGVLAVLGSGGPLLETIFYTQTIGLLLVLPATMCGIVAREREAGTLTLLRLTRLSPLEIALEKFLAAMVPIAGLLALSLPVMGVAYALGGVEDGKLFAAVYYLALTAALCGALTLAASAWSRTPVGAFLRAYFLVGLLHVGPVAAALLLDALDILDILHIPGSDDSAIFAFVGAYHFDTADHNDRREILTRGIPMAAATLIAFAAAWAGVRRRLSATPRKPIRTLFLRLDRLFKRLNRFVGGFELTGLRQLNADRPIAWRQARRHLLANPTHLLRLAIVINVPLCICMLFAAFRAYHRRDFLEIDILLAWIAAMLAIVGITFGAFSAERRQETLDVLLTTPIRSRDIILQTLPGCRAAALLVASPLVTIAVSHALLVQNHPILIFATVALPMAILFPLLIWTAAWFALAFRNRGKAIAALAATLAAWNILPIWLADQHHLLRQGKTLLVMLLAAVPILTGVAAAIITVRIAVDRFPRLRRRGRVGVGALLALCLVLFGLFSEHAFEPAYSARFMNEVGREELVRRVSPLALAVEAAGEIDWQMDWRPRSHPATTCFWLGLYAVLAVALRQHILANADRYLRRATPRRAPAPTVGQPAAQST